VLELWSIGAIEWCDEKTALVSFQYCAIFAETNIQSFQLLPHIGAKLQ
jgi:hypothetical protein